MTSLSYNYDTFEVTCPAEYVAHVEINRPEKLNSFKESYVLDLLVIFPNFHLIMLIECGSTSRRYLIDFHRIRISGQSFCQAKGIRHFVQALMYDYCHEEDAYH